MNAGSHAKVECDRWHLPRVYEPSANHGRVLFAMNSAKAFICRCISPHLFAHVQYDFDACEVNAHVTGKRKNHFQPFEIRIGIKSSVASPNAMA